MLLGTTSFAASTDFHAPPPAPPVQFGPVLELHQQPGARSSAQTRDGQVEWVLHKTEDGLHPSGEEQTWVWLMNRARQDPPAEGFYLANSGNSDIEAAISYFNVDTGMLQAEFNVIPAKPPAAFDRRLYEAAYNHSLALIARDSQDHDGQFDLVTAAGFSFSEAGGNVYSYARNAIHGHAGLNIDWGYGGTGGMQSPRGHRINIMSDGHNFTNVGIAAVSETNPNTEVGPWVVTGNYAEAATWIADNYNRFLVGTVWQDLNEDGMYNSGEGLADVTVTPDQGSFYAVTAAGGGYAIPIDAGSYRVSFAGGDLPNATTRDVEVGADSVLLDVLYTATQMYTLSIASVSGQGHISSDPAGIACPGSCNFDYAGGTTVTLTADPDEGSAFAGWSGACSGTLTTCTLTLDSAKTVSASFITASDPSPNANGMVYLSETGDTIIIPADLDAARTYLNFGGTHSYRIPSDLTAAVTIVDRQASSVVFSAGTHVDSVRFAADGIEFVINAQVIRLLGQPSRFSFGFAGAANHSFSALAQLFGTQIPDAGTQPVSGTPDCVILTTGALNCEAL
ncbi:hypothetical protein CKO36_17410 [Rhabdochromatium marinum]|nr:hypothetical protein [Rhabdochromatium marinum]